MPDVYKTQNNITHSLKFMSLMHNIPRKGVDGHVHSQTGYI